MVISICSTRVNVSHSSLWRKLYTHVWLNGRVCQSLVPFQQITNLLSVPSCNRMNVCYLQCQCAWNVTWQMLQKGTGTSRRSDKSKRPFFWHCTVPTIDLISLLAKAAATDISLFHTYHRYHCYLIPALSSSVEHIRVAGCVGGGGGLACAHRAFKTSCKSRLRGLASVFCFHGVPSQKGAIMAGQVPSILFPFFSPHVFYLILLIPSSFSVVGRPI